MRLGCVRGARIFFSNFFLLLKCDGTLHSLMLHPEQGLDDPPRRGSGSFFFFFLFCAFLDVRENDFCQIYIFCPVCGGSGQRGVTVGRRMQQADAAADAC